MTRVAIIASAAAVRAGLEALVRASDDVTVAATAATVDALLASPELASSDVVLVHTGTTDLAARQLDSLPPIPVVVLVGRPTGLASVHALLSAGARGVLPDDATGEEVGAALGAAAAGLLVIPPELIGDVVNVRAVGAPESTRSAVSGTRSTARAVTLTPREREVLAMLAEGLPNKAIASRLRISEHTVKTHLEAIFDKLGASTRADAVARGVRQGLLLL